MKGKGRFAFIGQWDQKRGWLSSVEQQELQSVLVEVFRGCPWPLPFRISRIASAVLPAPALKIVPGASCAQGSAGCIICCYIWLNLRWPAIVLGGAWLLAGLLWGACRKGGFRMMRDVA